MKNSESSNLLMDLSLSRGDRIELKLRSNRDTDDETDKLELIGHFIETRNIENVTTLHIKLDSGYNLGISLDRVADIKVHKRTEKQMMSILKRSGKPPIGHVALISTGGTIASRVDYRTGAVYPPQTPEDMLSSINDTDIMGVVDPRILMSKLSEDMGPIEWVRIAEEVMSAFSEGAIGCVISHGTDTLSYTACALSFLLRGLPGPVVLTGSQRSSDRPSTDSHQNLLDSIHLARNDTLREVCVVMHGNTSDGESHIHRGTRVRKMHTSSRDAFRSINDALLGKIINGGIHIDHDRQLKKDDTPFCMVGGFDESVYLLKYHPNLDVSLLDLLGDRYHCIVIEGTGLGHVRSDLAEPISAIVENGVPVIMTSSCINGMVNMNIYSTGRMLLRSGVIPAYDMHPESALVKAMYVLNDVGRDLSKKEMGGFKKAFLKDIAGEISFRTDISYLFRSGDDKMEDNMNGGT